MKDLTKYFIDLSKLSEEQIKELAFVMQRTKNLHDKAFDFMSKGKTFDRFICLAQTDSKEWTLWNLTAVFDKTELTYPEFIKLFEGGEEEIFPTNVDIWKWWEKQKFQKEQGEQEYTMIYEIDLPKILKSFFTHFNLKTKDNGNT